MNKPLALAAGFALSLIPIHTLQADHRSFSGRAFTGSARATAPMRSFSTARSFGALPHTSFRGAPLARGNFHYSPAHTSQSFAFGGHALNPNVRFQPSYRNYSYSDRFANRTLTSTVWRDWDRRHDHTWNHHRYRWAGNSWVIIDGGYGYGFGYPYYYDDSYYSAPYVTTSTADYDTGNSLAAEVQQALAAQGYYHDVIDGDVGPMTRDAIAAYQRDHRLPVTGTINTPLLDSLGLN